MEFILLSTWAEGRMVDTDHTWRHGTDNRQNSTAHSTVQAIAYREVLDKEQTDTKSNTSMQVVVGKKRFCVPEESARR
jgi:hypothetical protein